MEGCSEVLSLAIVVIVVFALLVGGVVWLWGQAQEAAAEHDRASANLERVRGQAQAELERARADRDYLRSQAWQERFMVYTAWLEANDDGGIVLGAAIVGALVGLIGVCLADKLIYGKRGY